MKILEKICNIKSMWCCGSACNIANADGSGASKKLCYIRCSLRCLTKLAFIAVCFAVFACCFMPKIIHRYLLKNPEVIIESVQKFSEQRQQEMQQASVGKVSEVYESAIKDKALPFLGNKNGSHVIVTFYDYACGYCKKSAAELKIMLARDPQLKVILKDLPLFGVSSIESAKASMFVYSKYPEKFSDFYFKMMSSKEINAKAIDAIAKSLGIKEDVIKASKSMFENEIRNNYVQAGEIRVDGTPATIIVGKLHLGLKSADDMAALLK